MQTHCCGARVVCTHVGKRVVWGCGVCGEDPRKRLKELVCVFVGYGSRGGGGWGGGGISGVCLFFQSFFILP